MANENKPVVQEVQAAKYAALKRERGVQAALDAFRADVGSKRQKTMIAPNPCIPLTYTREIDQLTYVATIPDVFVGAGVNAETGFVSAATSLCGYGATPVAAEEKLLDNLLAGPRRHIYNLAGEDRGRYNPADIYFVVGWPTQPRRIVNVVIEGEKYVVTGPQGPK